MDIISEEDLESVEMEIVEEKKHEVEVLSKDFDIILSKMSDPIDFQKQLATQLKQMIDKRVKLESEDGAVLSETTRRWMVDYNNILNTLHKNIHGDKSTHLNVNVVAHSDIASKIRKFKKK